MDKLAQNGIIIMEAWQGGLSGRREGAQKDPRFVTKSATSSAMHSLSRLGPPQN